jgi:hypothetical protein
MITSNGKKTANKAEKDNSKRIRAKLLADRIEQGAALLGAFAESVSEEEWNAPVAGNTTDRRPIGVIVHHVASSYPIEIELAQRIAGGQAVTDVTWDIVDRINATHADMYAGVTKQMTLELLKRNSSEAAEAVRAFTDEELDYAAPFSLNNDAPLTAQFVIEDHAVRHSWNHLGRIRAGLGR